VGEPALTHGELTCPACGSDAVQPFFAIERAPVFCNVQHATRDAALAAPTAPISLSLCESCELIANLDFDESAMAYAGGYENSLHFSPHFRSYAESIATSLIERYDIRNKEVVDIGCGQGDFLKLISRLGNNRGFGFDPSYQASRDELSAEHSDGADITIIPEAYGESLMSKPAALVCCRHVLEHIPHPLAFLRSVRSTIGDRTDTIVFFEVPSANWTINQLGVWDILYEHCSYFTPTALANVFTQARFDVLRIEETYGGQFVTIECRPAPADQQCPPFTQATSSVMSAVERFRSAYEDCVNTWKSRLDAMHAAGQKAVLWGAGTKGVMFLNTLAVSDALVPCVVDVNPNKHGRFIAGTGQKIIAPEELKTLQPDIVIVMNPLYVDEITKALANMSLSPNVVTV